MKKAIEMANCILSFLFFYFTLNWIRNVFLKPVFYDAFVCSDKGVVCVVCPYYSLRGFSRSHCVCVFHGDCRLIKPIIVDDPDRNCLIVLFQLPVDILELDSFDYAIQRGNKVLYRGTYVKSSVHKKYRLSMATLFKHETDFLKEWVEYHRSVGVEHIYLYENNPVPDGKIRDVIGPYVEEGFITHILWPYPYRFYNYNLKRFWPNDAYAYTQLPQVNHCLYKFAAETEWLLSCDVDEYFYSPVHSSLPKVIDTVNVHHDVSSIRIAGFWFGGGVLDVVRAKTAGVIRSFRRSERIPTGGFKCIFNTTTVRLASIHNSLLHEKNEITVSTNVLRFNHYRALGWKKRTDDSFAQEIENTDIIDEAVSNIHSGVL